ncbi:glycosyltransferase [candidate division KSB1 bacterium]|nr:glycosyltransferase [candidate division KSB1 bacterium]
MIQTSNLFFSVIVPSYNRLDEIQALVASLKVQTFLKSRFETIVVDDGSTDGTVDWVQANQELLEMNLRCIQQDHQGPGAARNLGMSKAQGQYFVFIDSDCTAPPDWLERIHAVLEADSSIQGFGGRDDARLDFPPLLKAINYSMTSFLTTGGLRGGRKKRLAKFYPRSFNMGIHRDLYKKIGGFGSLRHGQDIEFSHRMIQSNAKIEHIPDSVVYHRRRTSLIRFFRQVFNWGVARINLFKLDSGMLEPLHAAPAIAFWSVMILSSIALVWVPFRPVWFVLFLIAMTVLLLSAIHAAIKWRDGRTGLLTPVVMILQVSGYALGFSTAFIWRMILGRGEWTGFVKRYY